MKHIDIENFESTEGTLKSLKQKFPNRLPTDTITNLSTVARLQGQQQVIKYIEDMLITLNHKHNNNN